MSTEYIKSIEEADVEIGKFLEKMKRDGLYKDTHFMFLTDHGGIEYGHGGVSTNAVSYTHLDVYKRQTQSRSLQVMFQSIICWMSGSVNYIRKKFAMWFCVVLVNSLNICGSITIIRLSLIHI